MLDRKAARVRCDAATEGPWASDGEVVGWLDGHAPAVRVAWWDQPMVVTSDSDDFRVTSGTTSPVCMVAPEGSIQHGSDPVGGSPRAIEDAAFIGHARTDLPEALSLLDRCEAALKVVRTYVATITVVSQGRDGSAAEAIGELDALLRDLGGDA